MSILSPRFLAALLLALSLAGSVGAQEVTIPQSVPVAVGRLAAVEMTFDGDDFQYVVPPELDAFREYTTSANVVKLRVIGYTPGTYSITAVAAKAVGGKGKLSAFKTCLVVVGQGPGPTPPQPVPIPVPPPGPPKPEPPPLPIPAGPRQVLILRESADDTPAMSRLLVSLSSGKGRDYLKSKGHVFFTFDVDAKGADGQPDPQVTKWKAAIALPLPAMAILDSKGNVIHKETIPKDTTADEVLVALRRHE